MALSAVVAVVAAAFPTAASAVASLGGAGGSIVNFAGSTSYQGGNGGDGGPATVATLLQPTSLAADSAGDIYVADTLNNRVRKIDAGGTITNFAGNRFGTAGDSGDGGPATSATLDYPSGVTIDLAGNVYIADSVNNRVRKVDTSGTITNFAGISAGSGGNSGDGGPATSASLRFPTAVTVDPAGDVYVADSANNRVRKVDTGGIITDYAGNAAGSGGNAGDAGPATSARLMYPIALAVGPDGNLYIVDTDNNRVRKVDTSGTIANVAGSPSGAAGDSGDGGAATSATLASPIGVAFDAEGNLFIVDANNSRVRKVDASGTIANFAGSPTRVQGNGGDGGAATSATLSSPYGVAVDPAGNVFIADQYTNRVRVVLAATVNATPVITSAASALLTVGTAGSFTVTADGFPVPTVTEAGTLPSGVTFNSATATLSGTPSLGAAGTYPVTFQAANGIGSRVSQGFTLRVAQLPGYQAVVPVRICDTRASGPGVVANQCDTHGHSPLSTGGVLTFATIGVGGVPGDATAAVLHVTAAGTNAASYLTVWPAGRTQPTAASLNWTAGQATSNLVETALGNGAGGPVSVFNYAGSADVIVDLQGYVKFTGGALLVPMTPVRVCDTRLGQPANQCNANGTAAGDLGPGKKRVVNVENGFGVPAGATSVVLNVTATTTSAASYLTVWPDGDTQPLAASINWTTGQSISNQVITAVSAAGNIDLFNANGSTDVVVDMSGYFTAASGGSGYYPVTPLRVCDTRPVGPGVAANTCNSQGPGTLGAGQSLLLAESAPNITALVFNVTVTNTVTAGFFTLYPSDTVTPPMAANITWAAHQTIGNMVVADLGSLAATVLHNGSGGNTDVVVDWVGYYTNVIPGSATANAKSHSLVTSITATRGAKRSGK